MTFTSLISVNELLPHLGDPQWAIMDCRFSLVDTERGWRDYQQAHIPGAVYVHLDHDLCAPLIPGKTGRHPLPPAEQLVDRFSAWGIASGVQVVVYDDWPAASGAIAARLWWSLRYLGHQEVAVLDGGWEQWRAKDGATRRGIERRAAQRFIPHLHPELLATRVEVERFRTDPACRVFDSRSADRYRGENETIDPVAGHIPGAISAPFAENMSQDGLFLSPEALAQRFRVLLGDVPSSRAIFYCGSGVTAAHNLVALARAGVGDARLYVGSWSEWITDPTNPVAR